MSSSAQSHSQRATDTGRTGFQEQLGCGQALRTLLKLLQALSDIGKVCFGFSVLLSDLNQYRELEMSGASRVAAQSSRIYVEN